MPLRILFAGTPEFAVPMMHGFLNVLLATAVFQRGESLEMARAILLENDPAAFTLQDEAVRWRDTTFDRVQLWTLRQRGFRAFGSCSFREPVDELAAMTPR